MKYIKCATHEDFSHRLSDDVVVHLVGLPLRGRAINKTRVNNSISRQGRAYLFIIIRRQPNTAGKGTRKLFQEPLMRTALVYEVNTMKLGDTSVVLHSRAIYFDRWIVSLGVRT